MKKLIKNIIRKLKDLAAWRRRVWKAKSDYKVPFFTKVKYALKGFATNEYVWFDFAKNDYHNYISDYERVRSRNINGNYKTILDDKLLFEEIFRNHTRVPIIYAWVSDGVIYGIHEYELNNSNVIEFIKNIGCAVLKWETGYEGKGTYIIKNEVEKNSLVVNGKTMRDSEVIKLFSNNGQAILCEYMHQSEFENELYPDATNTIRIICAKKKGEKTAHIIKAAQRIGNKESAPVDNVSAGAISCEINIDNGELLQGVIAKAHHKSNGERFFDIHPDTGAVLAGKQIPGWEKLKKDIEDMTNKFPYLNFVGWDVLLLDDGFCIIEGNASSGLMMFQQRHGVRNEEIGDIYRSYGIIK
jgi:hypothetical protein